MQKSSNEQNKIGSNLCPILGPILIVFERNFQKLIGKGCVSQCDEYRSKDTMLQLYKSLSRPRLMY